MTRIYIKDIKNGDVFYECEGGHNYEFTATDDAYRVEKQQDRAKGWGVEALSKDKEVVPFFVSDGFDHYC